MVGFCDPSRTGPEGWQGLRRPSSCPPRSLWSTRLQSSFPRKVSEDEPCRGLDLAGCALLLGAGLYSLKPVTQCLHSPFYKKRTQWTLHKVWSSVLLVNVGSSSQTAVPQTSEAEVKCVFAPWFTACSSSPLQELPVNLPFLASCSPASSK